MRQKIGECLIQAGLITEEDLQAALAEHQRSGERVGAVLVRMNLASEKQITKALAYQLGFPYVNLAEVPPDAAAVVLIPKDVALHRVCVALKIEKNQLTVAMADPLLFSLVQDLEFQTGYRIKQVVAAKTDIITAIHTGYPDKALALTGEAGEASLAPPGLSGGAHVSAESGTLVLAADDSVFESGASDEGRGDQAPIVAMVDLIVGSAVTSLASDIHIEPTENRVVVRHRLDGILREVMDLPRWVGEGLVARMKILAGMDISEKRLPQDGRLRAEAEGGPAVDLRVSTLRTLFGEKIVLRVLDQRKGPPPLADLGVGASGLEDLRRFLRHQHGMILVVGPTGSGKTTTLCSAISSIQSTRTNIITIEDPIEYQLSGVNQTQVNEKITLTFANSLRAILRQDPDVILVGEIRDFDTAKIALQAAQTGHLVLSTLHTDDAPSTATRLMDMGVEPYVIGSALVGVVAQRLVRRLCMHCREQYTPSPEELRALGIPDIDADRHPFYRAVGCEQCNQTGYRGRMGLYEIMTVGDKLRRAIAGNVGEDALRDAALASGMTTLSADGLTKVKSGVTTAEELLRVVTEVRELRASCPGCSAPVEPEYQACPRCGYKLMGGCSSCGRALEPGWSFCPHCSTLVESTRSVGAGTQLELPAPNVTDIKTFQGADPIPPRRRSGGPGPVRRDRPRGLIGGPRAGEVTLRRARGLALGDARRNQAGFSAADRALPPRQGPPSRPRAAGDGGRTGRRDHRGLSAAL